MNSSINKYVILIFFTIIIGNQSLFAQNKIKVQSTGSSISRDLTPKEALKEAIKDAQNNAFKKAGIIENVSVSNILYTTSYKDDVEQYFNEISTIESNANIIVDRVYNEKRSFDDFGNMIISVEIDATVFEYKQQKDASFYIKIKGLKDKYNKTDNISFSVIPSKDGYLKIFTVTDTLASILYPFKNCDNDYLSDKDSILKKGEEIFFPIHPAYKPGYSIELNSDVEINSLIFVFTKYNIPWFDDEINLKTILNWIYSIKQSDREIQYKTIVLRK